MLISFAIVNWKGGPTFRRCIATIAAEIAANPEMDCEVIVVDNGSPDEDVRFLYEYSFIKIIRNAENVGFAEGTNQSVAASSGENIFLLNNDVLLIEGAVRSLYDQLLKSPNVGIVAPRLLYMDGRIQASISNIPRPRDFAYRVLMLNRLNKRLDQWRQGSFDYGQPAFVEQPMFSALLMRRRVWDEIGELDRQFPIFFNDVDWFYRFRRHGKWKCLYWPFASCYHVRGMSTGRHKLKKVVDHARGCYRFFAKQYDLGQGKRILMILLVLLDFILRAGYEYIRAPQVLSPQDGSDYKEPVTTTQFGENR